MKMVKSVVMFTPPTVPAMAPSLAPCFQNWPPIVQGRIIAKKGEGGLYASSIMEVDFVTVMMMQASSRQRHVQDALPGVYAARSGGAQRLDGPGVGGYDLYGLHRAPVGEIAADEVDDHDVHRANAEDGVEVSGQATDFMPPPMMCREMRTVPRSTTGRRGKTPLVVAEIPWSIVISCTAI